MNPRPISPSRAGRRARRHADRRPAAAPRACAAAQRTSRTCDDRRSRADGRRPGAVGVLLESTVGAGARRGRRGADCRVARCLVAAVAAAGARVAAAAAVADRARVGARRGLATRRRRRRSPHRRGAPGSDSSRRDELRTWRTTKRGRWCERSPRISITTRWTPRRLGAAGAADRLTLELSEPERTELARLLEEQLKGRTPAGVGLVTSLSLVRESWPRWPCVTAPALGSRRRRTPPAGSRREGRGRAQASGRRSSPRCSTPTPSSRRRPRCS